MGAPDPHPLAAGGAPRLTARGKFLFRGDDKVYLRGVSYGPFAPAEDGCQFPAAALVRRDLALMRELGANTVRCFTVPPRWLLDLAHEADLGVLVGLPWSEHVSFLDDPAITAQVRAAVDQGVDACAGHPAVSAYLVGNEIPPDIVRWLGVDRVRRFVESLAAGVRRRDPRALVGYASFPPTEYLDLGELDFVAFNVYLHRPADFRRYLLRLQNLAGDKPLLLTELGIDSMREGEAAQATILDWQLRAAFALGLAGASVFAWTDEWHTGGQPVDDWAFGLVDRDRRRKPAFAAVQRLYREALPALPDPAPRVSVVVCAYNAEGTIQPCLESLRALRYPDVEVIVVDDGSSDATAAIARQHPWARLISQPNRGLSAARNAGIAAATGALIAFTDADCVVDPDWLTYLAWSFTNPDAAAVGGPNLPPPQAARTAACVAAAPGGPTHVLLDDETAEHIPGCNMAFRREALAAIGGFDPLFRAAGDDVDVCWRLQDAGLRIGFSPAAMVWHFRRDTVRAYLSQQRGYGAAEALLAQKHPYRFNLLGQSRWLGRIYGDLEHGWLLRRPVIYYGTYGRALFQTLYESPASALSWLPFTLEWNLLAVVLLVTGVLSGDPLPLALLPLLVSLAAAGARGWRARLAPEHDRWSSRALVALLTYLGPLARSWQRYRTRLAAATPVDPVWSTRPLPPARVRWRRTAIEMAFWSEAGHDKEDFLHALAAFLRPRRVQVAVDQGWRACDLDVHAGLWAHVAVLTAVEYHGGDRRLLRVRCAPRLSLLGRIALALLLAAALALGFGGPAASAAVAAGAAAAGVAFGGRAVLGAGRMMSQVTAIVAERLGLVPVSERR
ncbi:glycosyltransferase [bacterium]|nr:glycosyltransferase [bacterium]